MRHKDLFSKRWVLDNKRWPQEFLQNLISEIPVIDVDGRMKLKWSCEKHGVYEQSIYEHLRSCRCPKCARASRKREKYSQEHNKEYFEFVRDDCEKDLQGSSDLSKCLNGEKDPYDRVMFICKDHGTYVQSLAYHKLHSYCPICQGRVESNKYEDLLHDVEGSEDYNRLQYGEALSHDKVQFNCKKHGFYEQKIYSHLAGKGCPECAKEKRPLSYSKNRRGNNPFSKEMIEALSDNSRVLLKEGKLFRNDKVEFFCTEHGFYYMTPTNFIAGCRCPKCSLVKRSFTRSKNERLKNPYPDWFLKDIEDSPDRDLILNSKVNTRTNVAFVCEEHGLYYQTIHNHLRGAICPTCAAQKVAWQSTVEKSIIENYDKLKSVQSYRGLIKSEASGYNMELDVYFTDYKVALECNGFYWHSIEHMESVSNYNAIGGKQNYHLMKSNLCKDKDIVLIHLFEDDTKHRYSVCLNHINNILKLKGAKLEQTYIKLLDCSIVEDSLNFRDFALSRLKGSKFKTITYNGDLVASISYNEGDIITVRNIALNSKYSLDMNPLSVLLSEFDKDICIEYEYHLYNGDCLKYLGFELLEITPPHRINVDILSIKRTKEESNYHIYDCGIVRWIKRI